MSMNRKLRRLFAQYGKNEYSKFNKTKHIPLIAKKMKKEQIDKEIIEILTKFKHSTS